MSLIRRREANGKTRRAGVLRKSVAQLAVLGLMATGAFAAVAVATAGAQEIDLCHIDTEAQSGGVSICKTGPETAVAGTDITYTLDINAWGYWNKNFEVDDQVPDGTSLVSVTPSDNIWDCSESADPNVVCKADDADPDDVDDTTITVVAHIDSGLTDEFIENCATIERSYVLKNVGVDSSGNSGDESCWETEITRESDIAIEKVGPATLVLDPANLPGNVIAYDITVTNNGPSDSDPVTIEDTLPAGTTLVSAIGDAFDCTGSPVNPLTCTTVDGIVSGETATLTVTLNVPLSQAGNQLENCVSVTDGDTSGVTTNDSSCSTIAAGGVTVKAAEVVAAVPVAGVSPRFTG